MTKDKKTMLGIVAAIGAILGYSYYKKKKDLTDSGVDDLIKAYQGGTQVVTTNDPNQNVITFEELEQAGLQPLTAEEQLKRFGITS